MNDIILPLIAFALGTVIGMATVAFMVGRRGADEDLQPLASVTDDTELLDFVEQFQCNLFYNSKVGNGAWGLLGGSNDVLSVGTTLRQAVKSAITKHEINTVLEGSRVEA